jgi:uncharacterized protein Yka (UPF0111/DUF47 family)
VRRNRERLVPRFGLPIGEDKFYSLLGQAADNVVAAGALLVETMDDFAHLEMRAERMREVEHQGDFLTHQMMNQLQQSFVTPIDREDIHLLASRLDNVIDLVDGTARRAAMFGLREVREPAKQLADVLIAATDYIQDAVGEIKRSREVQELARQIKLREEEGDTIYHEAVGALFRGSPDPLDVIKWKELYDTLERALDECEDVANVVESISLKHA